MLEIPLEAVPNQRLLAVLAGQNCTISVYQRGRRMYLDLAGDDKIVRQGAVCLPRVPLLGDVQQFAGQLFFVDMGAQPVRQEPPQWQGLGSRWKLIYLDNEELQTL